MEEIKKIKNKKLKGYLYAMLKRTDIENLARAIQRTLALPVTGSFDESTINKINRLALRSYDVFKRNVERYI